MNRHSSCKLRDNCGAEDCDAARTSRDRQATKAAHPEWDALVAKRDSGGWRHYLGGVPVSCGNGLVLQGVAERWDDYGDFTIYLPTGTLVRYEANLSGDRERPTATLHVEIAGHR